MALPLLVNGSECGPSNPLQGLSKRFDHDRGLQQDHFGASRTAPLRETFRTQTALAPGLDQDASSFFAAGTPPPSAFDFSSLHISLPPPPSSSMHIPDHSVQAHRQLQQQQNTLEGWATDFMQVSTPQMASQTSKIETQQQAPVHPHRVIRGVMQQQLQQQWGPTFSGYGIGQMPVAYMPTQAHMPMVQVDQSLWDKEFQSQEQSLALAPTIKAPAAASLLATTPQTQTQTRTHATPHQQDELARTAGLLVDAVQDEINVNPKFQNSLFMGLMRQLRDGAVVVEGNSMVEVEAGGETHMSTAVRLGSDFRAEVVGKGKARASDPVLLGEEDVDSLAGQSATQDPIVEQQQQGEDPNDVYFQQENESFTKYWNDFHTEAAAPLADSAESSSWDKLQRDWDQFEATSTGIRAIDNYQFQPNNPYLLGDSSRTRHRMLQPNALFESVLELEAAVQSDPTNARAWYDLGVKQQENEREQKALQALQRAVELDPAHLPAWLALGVSHTNDGNRLGTYTAIQEWVERNERYAMAVRGHRARMPEDENPSVAISEQFTWLVQCLIAMARSEEGGEVDADIQIALAVLLNTIEDYGKAQDCFRTALAVRPDDWLLYNRVGATMANSGRAEDALQYYYRALELNPAYIRARFNLGISCINLRRYEEAAHHILDALVLQDSDSVGDASGYNDKRGVTSAALWESLKTTCLHMQRMDLAALTELRDVDSFRNAFPQ